MANLSILIIVAATITVVSSVTLPDCLNCEVCVKAVPIRAGGCSLPTVFSGSLDTCLPDVPTPCPSPLVVYELNTPQRKLVNPSVVYDFSTKQFRIYENGIEVPFPRVAVINTDAKTIFFYDSVVGFVLNTNLVVAEEQYVVGYNVGSNYYYLPSDQSGIYFLTTKGTVIPK